MFRPNRYGMFNPGTFGGFDHAGMSIHIGCACAGSHNPGASGNTFDTHGNLFQSNIAGDRIDKVTPDGTRSVFAIGANISNAVGLAHDSSGNLYVSNCGDSLRKLEDYFKTRLTLRWATCCLEYNLNG